MQIHSQTIVWHSTYASGCIYGAGSLTVFSPASPAQMDWASHYPAYAEAPVEIEGTEDSMSIKKMKQDVDVADIGCGFGGLTVALAPKLPNSLILGMDQLI